jgi:hypothetical protein
LRLFTLARELLRNASTVNITMEVRSTTKVVTMTIKNAEIPSYPACGHRMPLGSEPADPCFRCAMVAALIEELIRKQTRVIPIDRMRLCS